MRERTVCLCVCVCVCVCVCLCVKTSLPRQSLQREPPLPPLPSPSEGAPQWAIARGGSACWRNTASCFLLRVKGECSRPTVCVLSVCAHKFTVYLHTHQQTHTPHTRTHTLSSQTMKCCCVRN